MDVGAGLTLFGVAAGSAKVIEKILGPTAEYIGDNMRGWTEKGATNVSKIFQKAEEKLGDEINEEGAVPPKVLKEILDSGFFCDDELGQEYFGGVLASSRTSVSRDDRGATYVALIGRMTTYQIRAHYVLYHIVKQVYNGCGALMSTLDRHQLEIFVPFDSFLASLDFVPEEEQKTIPIITHVFFGLARDELLDTDFTYGPPEYMKSQFAGASGAGILFRPSVLGVELFHWAHGMGDIEVTSFFEKSTIFSPKPDVSIPTDAIATKQFVATPQLD